MKYILNLTFSLWCELLSKKMVYNGTHADKALIAQSVPVHTTQDVYCLIDLITVNILEDDVYQTQVSLCEDTCHKKYIKSSESFKNKNNKNTFNSREEKKKTVIFSCIKSLKHGVCGGQHSYGTVVKSSSITYQLHLAYAYHSPYIKTFYST